VTPGRKLSPREERILRLLTEGYSQREIAKELGSALPTVRTHISHIYLKLDAKNRAHAVAIWMKRNR
jgi:DNA-binding CsgD family transcriptional regulator